jgi:hypothetical protein
MDIHLLPKSRTAARHFLVRKMVNSAVTKPFLAEVVACGEELPEMRLSDLAQRTTKDPDAVTCAACWDLAHPAPSQFPQ